MRTELRVLVIPPQYCVPNEGAWDEILEAGGFPSLQTISLFMHDNDLHLIPAILSMCPALNTVHIDLDRTSSLIPCMHHRWYIFSTLQNLEQLRSLYIYPALMDRYNMDLEACHIFVLSRPALQSVALETDDEQVVERCLPMNALLPDLRFLHIGAAVAFCNKSQRLHLLHHSEAATFHYQHQRLMTKCGRLSRTIVLILFLLFKNL